MRETSTQIRDRAINAIKPAAGASKDRARLDFIVLALRGRKVGFEKVIKMIDEMVSALKAEQTSDEDKKEYCASQLDTAEDKMKALERKVSDTETAIASMEEGITETAIASME